MHSLECKLILWTEMSDQNDVCLVPVAHISSIPVALAQKCLLMLPAYDHLSNDVIRHEFVYGFAKSSLKVLPEHDPENDYLPPCVTIVQTCLHAALCKQLTIPTDPESWNPEQKSSFTLAVQQDNINTGPYMKVIDHFTNTYNSYCIPRVRLVKRLRQWCRINISPRVIFARLELAKDKIPFDRLDLPFQDLLVTTLMDDPVMSMYPSLEDGFWTIMVREIEFKNLEVHSRLLEFLTTVFRSGRFRHNNYTTHASYKTYQINPQSNQNPVHISSNDFWDSELNWEDEKEAKLITVRASCGLENDVGLKTWPAGDYMAAYILAHQDEFVGKVCFEIGAGSGLTTLVLSTLEQQPKAIIATDYTREAINNLAFNFHMNKRYIFDYRIDEEKIEFLSIINNNKNDNIDAKRGKVIPCLVGPLDWCDPDVDGLLSSFHSDVMIACDTIYLPDYMNALVNTFSMFLKSNKSSKNERCIYSMQALRDPDTFAIYESELNAAELRYENIKVDKSWIAQFGLSSDPNSKGVLLYKITL